VVRDDGGGGPTGASDIRGASFYDDRYVKVDDGWRIQHTGYKRVFEEIEPRSPDVRMTASWWGTDGRSSLG
jgi:SnoaL-like domain